PRQPAAPTNKKTTPWVVTFNCRQWANLIVASQTTDGKESGIQPFVAYATKGCIKGDGQTICKCVTSSRVLATKPKGIRLKAQSCGATLGYMREVSTTLKGVACGGV
ncbi:MAG: hypothetical protein SGI71_03865, partial [Verrucomicrobiota bacterium]|nr:hypothetical protein [Verrucomicrobiota bacterium]